MKIAITGATGFIGRHVVRHLEERGCSPYLLSRKAESIPTSFRRHTTTSFDLKAPPSDAFQRLGAPDVLIHLAWEGLPNYQSLHHFEDELPAQYRFLKSLVQCGLRTLLVTGTCFEYGMQSGPLNEKLVPNPASAYGYAKDGLRRQLQCLQTMHPFNLIWTRLFYVFGEGQRSAALKPQLDAAIERGEKCFNMSPGDQLRDYLPVDEVARTLVELALTGREIGIVNVCSGKPISVRQLVENWIESRNASIGLNLGYYPYPAYEPIAFWGSRTLLERQLQT